MLNRLAWVVLMCVCAAARSETAQWRLVMREDFAGSAALAHWRLDGAADASVTSQGELLIQTQKRQVDGKTVRCSVLWYERPFWGDLRIEFDARGERGNRCILFFNAQPRGGRGLFDWTRPLARYGDYAWDERLRLHSVGILRYDQPTINLRRLGWGRLDYWRQLDTLPRRDPKRRKIYDEFQVATVLARFASPFKDPQRMSHIELRVEGERITLRVDGKKAVSCKDKRMAEAGRRGGYFGFRNFRPSRAWFDNVRVWRKEPSARNGP